MHQLTLSPSPKLGPLFLSALILGLVGFAVVGFYSFGAMNLTTMSAWIVSLGFWGPIAYIALLILSVVISQIPGAPLAILAGTIWPPFWAAIFTIVGGFIGATLAYSLGHQLGAPLMQKITGKTLELQSNQTWKRLGSLIFLSRLFPIVPFDLLSYGAGVSRVPWLLYATATLLGMIPSTFLLAYGTTVDLPGIAAELYSYF